MGDDDDLGVFELPQHADETVDVGVVESGVDFVEHAEGAGTRTEDRQEEGDARHRLLTPGEQGDASRLFAGGAGDDLDGRLEDVDAGLEDDVCLSASENPLEEGAEMTADRLDRLGEEATAVLVDPGDELLDRQFGVGDVGELGFEPRQPFGKLLRFGERLEVDGRHRGELPLQLIDARIERGTIGGDLLRGRPFLRSGFPGRLRGGIRRLDVDVVLIADPLHDPHAPVPGLAGLEFAGVNLVAEAAGGSAGADRGVGGGRRSGPDRFLARDEEGKRRLRMLGGPRRLGQQAPCPEDVELSGVETVANAVVAGEDRESQSPPLLDLRGTRRRLVLCPRQPLPARCELDAETVDFLGERPPGAVDVEDRLLHLRSVAAEVGQFRFGDSETGGDLVSSALRLAGPMLDRGNGGFCGGEGLVGRVLLTRQARGVGLRGGHALGVVLTARLQLADGCPGRGELGLEIADHRGVVVAAPHELVMSLDDGLQLGPAGHEPHGTRGASQLIPSAAAALAVTGDEQERGMDGGQAAGVVERGHDPRLREEPRGGCFGGGGLASGDQAVEPSDDALVGGEIGLRGGRDLARCDDADPPAGGERSLAGICSSPWLEPVGEAVERSDGDVLRRSSQRHVDKRCPFHRRVDHLADDPTHGAPLHVVGCGGEQAPGCLGHSLVPAGELLEEPAALPAGLELRLPAGELAPAGLERPGGSADGLLGGADLAAGGLEPLHEGLEVSLPCRQGLGGGVHPAPGGVDEEPVIGRQAAGLILPAIGAISLEEKPLSLG